MGAQPNREDRSRPGVADPYLGSIPLASGGELHKGTFIGMTHATAPSMKTKPQKRHKYIVIRDWLSEQIASGAFARGEQIPSEHELMQRFEVSRVTARQALTDLRNKGLIEAHHGKGYFVSRFTATSNLERLQSFGEMMAPLGIETCSDIIELSEVRADQATAHSLGLSLDAPLTKLVRTRNAGGRTVALTINHLPVALGRRVMCLDLGNQDLYRLMEDRLKIELAYADTVLDTGESQQDHWTFHRCQIG